MPDLNPKLGASLNIHPKGSQVVIVSLVVLILCCLGGAFFFLHEDKHYYSIPGFVMSAAFFYFVREFWLASHERVDNSVPPQIAISHQDGGTQTNISADSQVVRSRENVANFIDLISAVMSRRPLPLPDGLIDETGSIIPESSSEAQKRVASINERVEVLWSKMMEGDVASDGEQEGLEQSSLENAGTQEGRESRDN